MTETRGYTSPEILGAMYRYRRAGIWTIMLAGLASLYSFLMSMSFLPSSRALEVLLPCLTVWFISMALYSLLRSDKLMNRALQNMDRSAMMRLERMARTTEPGSAHDYLYLKARLEEEKARVDRHGGVMTLLYLELDDYDDIKAEYGTKITEQVLDQLSESIVSQLRQYDALRRIYPNRYLVLLPATNRRNALKVARSLIQMAQDYSHILPAGGCISQLSMKCGIAAYPINGDDVENVVSAAHSACSEACLDEGENVLVSEQFIQTGPSGEQIVSDLQGLDT